MLLNIKERIDECVRDLRAGRLTEEALRAVASAAVCERTQSLLFIQAMNTNPGSPAIGYSLFRRGFPVPANPDQSSWPYRSVADAICDGWRVVSFPNTALLLDDLTTYGLGCEFILERFELD